MERIELTESFGTKWIKKDAKFKITRPSLHLPAIT